MGPALVLWIVTASFMVAGAAVLRPRLESGDLGSIFNGWSLLTDQADIWAWCGSITFAWSRPCGARSNRIRKSTPASRTVSARRFGPSGNRRSAAFDSASQPTSSRRRCRWWIDVSFATLTAIVAFLATNAGVALAMLAALYLDRQLPPLYRAPWWLFASGVVSAVILVGVSCVSG